MLGYALNTERCRREQLLAFMGRQPEPCGGCDVCDRRMLHLGLASYHGFGSLVGWQDEEIEEALDTLRRQGAIKVLKRGFWKDRVTSLNQDFSF
jgi:hypothetical protein